MKFIHFGKNIINSIILILLFSLFICCEKKNCSNGILVIEQSKNVLFEIAVGPQKKRVAFENLI